LTDNKETSPTWITSSPFSEEKYVLLFIKTLLTYGWFTPYIVLQHDANVLFVSTSRALHLKAAKVGIRPVRGFATSILKTISDFDNELDEFHRTSRGQWLLY
jgi:hypothetical protein